MRISQRIYDQLLACPTVPPEMGGVLGLRNADVIDAIAFDHGIPNGNGGTYVPDTAALNRVLATWDEEGIRFAGMFHTHAEQWPELSKEDRSYIITILDAMPPAVDCLYFPLVFPGSRVRGYMARRRGGRSEIVDVEIETISD